MTSEDSDFRDEHFDKLELDRRCEIALVEALRSSSQLELLVSKIISGKGCGSVKFGGKRGVNIEAGRLIPIIENWISNQITFITDIFDYSGPESTSKAIKELSHISEQVSEACRITTTANNLMEVSANYGKNESFLSSTPEPLTTVFGFPVKYKTSQSTVKKRMSPKVVTPAEISLSGNISSMPDSEDIFTSSRLFHSSDTPALTSVQPKMPINNISSANIKSKINKQILPGSTGIIVPNRDHLSASDRINIEKLRSQDSISSFSITSNISTGSATTSATESPASPNGEPIVVHLDASSHNADSKNSSPVISSHNLQPFLDQPLRIFRTIVIGTGATNKAQFQRVLIESPSKEQVSEARSSCCADLVNSMACFYCSLIKGQIISLKSGILTLLQLANFCISRQSIASFTEPSVIHISTDIESVAYIFRSDWCLAQYLISLLSEMRSFAKSLGPYVLNCLLSVKMLKIAIPDVIEDLILVQEELTTIISIEESSFHIPETFIRPFRDDVDNRNEYKTQIELGIYNERERCYDSFNDILLKFKDFSRNNSPSFTYPMDPSKILQSLQDVNIPWFAGIFTQLLLFHCLQDSDDGKSKSKADNQSSRLIELLHPAHSSSNKSSGANQCFSSNDSSRHKFPLPYNNSTKSKSIHQGSVSKSPNMNGSQYYNSPSSHMSTSQSFVNLLAVPAATYPGNQLFFFRFITQCDNHRFSQCLLDCLTAAILSQSEPSRNDASAFHDRFYNKNSSTLLQSTTNLFSGFSSEFNNNESFILRVLKLQLLGKFYGLISFLHNWTLTLNASLSTGDRGPAHMLAAENARKRNNPLRHNAQCLLQLIETAWINGRLSTVLPWIIQFLLQMTWDSFAHLSNPYEDIFAILKAIQESNVFKLDHLSTNRFFMIMELQELWRQLPTVLLPSIESVIKASKKLTKLSVLMTSADAPRRLDDQSQSLSITFIKHLLKPIYKDILRMRSLQNLSLHQGKLIRDFPMSRISKASISSASVSLGSFSSDGSDALVKVLIGRSKSNSISSSDSQISSHGKGAHSYQAQAVTAPTLSSDNVIEYMSSGNHSQSRLISPTRRIKKLQSETSFSSTTSSSATRRINQNIPASPVFRSNSYSSNSISGSHFSYSGSYKDYARQHLQYTSPSLTSPLPPKLVRSQSNSSNQQHQIPSKLSHSAEISAFDATEKMEQSFWQQHSEMYQTSLFLIHHAYQSRLAHLKDRVAVAVRDMWALTSNIKYEIDKNGREDVNSSAAYESTISAAAMRLHGDVVEESSCFIVTFAEKYLQASFDEMFSMYPIHEYVKLLAKSLTKRQFDLQHEDLLVFISKYLKRKLDEVCLLSVKQFNKSTELQRSKSRPPSTVLSMGPANLHKSTPLECKSYDIVCHDRSVQLNTIDDVENNLRELHGILSIQFSDAPSVDSESLSLFDKFSSKPLIQRGNIFQSSFCMGITTQSYEEHASDRNKVCHLNHLFIELSGAIATYMVKHSTASGQDRDSNQMKSLMRAFGILSANFYEMFKAYLFWLHQIRKPMKMQYVDKIDVCMSTTLVRLGTSLVIIDHINGSMNGRLENAYDLDSSILGETKSSENLLYDQTIIWTSEQIKILSTINPKSVYCDLSTTRGLYFVSDLLIFAVHFDVITQNSLRRLFVVLSRKSNQTFYESCRGFSNFKSLHPALMLDLIGKYLYWFRYKFGLECYFEMELDEEDESEMWFSNPSLRLEIKKAVCPELAISIQQLTQRLY